MSKLGYLAEDSLAGELLQLWNRLLEVEARFIAGTGHDLPVPILSANKVSLL